VRNIVLLHGGSIAVESVPREGTTFSLELPLAP
jgi:signal transduction histidine kinase